MAWALLVQDGILVLPEFVNHGLYPQHQELVPQMQAELQIILGVTKGVLGSPAGLHFCKSPPVVPSRPLQFHHIPSSKCIGTASGPRAARRGWGRHPFTLLVTRFRSPASLLLHPSPAFSKILASKSSAEERYRAHALEPDRSWFQSLLCHLPAL